MSTEVTKRQSIPRMLRLREVMQRTGLSRSTIYAYIQKSEFPPNRKIGMRLVGWLESDINLWIASRLTHDD